LHLAGGRKSPRDAVGATVYLTASGLRQRGDVLSGGGYLSSNDMRVHFGLGSAARIDALEIQWPSRTTEKVKLPAVDRIYIITEGKGITGALCKGKPCAARVTAPAKAPAKPSPAGSAH
jgi:predicted NUDIX family NTP pyrophosphohydrolase